MHRHNTRSYWFELAGVDGRQGIVPLPLSSIPMGHYGRQAILSRLAQLSPVQRSEIAREIVCELHGLKLSRSASDRNGLAASKPSVPA